MNYEAAETLRLTQQADLDNEVTQEYRNARGQFATPSPLAQQIAAYALAQVEKPDIKVLEPSCGSGAFIHAVLKQSAAAEITGVELDDRFAQIAKALWPTAQIYTGDYLEWSEDHNDRYDLIITNPPYSRHHHLSEAQKKQYQRLAQSRSGISKVSQLSSLYVPFLLASHSMMKPGGIGTWLIPSEVMSTNYGKAVREYLTQKVSLVRIHVFDASTPLFDDALVSSCVITFRNFPPQATDTVALTFGSNYEQPDATRIAQIAELQEVPKWLSLFPHRFTSNAGEILPTLGESFQARRGIATGGNKFFIRPREDFHRLGISDKYLTPVAPMPRNLKVTTIENGADGWPSNVEQLALLNIPSDVPEPEILEFLAAAPDKVRESYLARNRNPWWKQEQRPPAPILVTYMGRSTTQPFRFIRNRSLCTFTNSFIGLYLRTESQPVLDHVEEIDSFLDAVVEELRQIPVETLVNAGREYGGGLKKLEPKELLSLPLQSLAPTAQLSLFE